MYISFLWIGFLLFITAAITFLYIGRCVFFMFEKAKFGLRAALVLPSLITGAVMCFADGKANSLILLGVAVLCAAILYLLGRTTSLMEIGDSYRGLIAFSIFLQDFFFTLLMLLFVVIRVLHSIQLKFN